MVHSPKVNKNNFSLYKRLFGYIKQKTFLSINLWNRIFFTLQDVVLRLNFQIKRLPKEHKIYVPPTPVFTRLKSCFPTNRNFSCGPTIFCSLFPCTEDWWNSVYSSYSSYYRDEDNSTKWHLKMISTIIFFCKSKLSIMTTFIMRFADIKPAKAYFILIVVRALDIGARDWSILNND